MIKTIQLLGFLCFIITFSNCTSDDEQIDGVLKLVTDVDGNIYNTLKLGNQTWMLENLKTTKYNDGTAITKYTFQTFGNNWGNLDNQEGLYQWSNTSDLNNVIDQELTFDFYGAMYNHWAIESGKLAPKGWKIPSVEDFKELESYLAENGYAGKEAETLKTTSGWLPSSGNGTNAVGFNALPNGYINAIGGATLAEGITTWATSSFNSTNKKRTMINLFNKKTISYEENAYQIGAGIRCIKE
ncbi:fibrobacter succinogenes major paralogous domain-containing protein [Polaribacter glomeratus]|uniref:Fibrobacter succinogenes major paralogous domain-containing protein n=1 Tax=Polaribacter glomeratus TaxID=102 RepID=A0A2S7WVQ8_9FLAO|nr:fibrobacter succinogenes major paralogous domain-containing protein [Polaribacter glomeratus]PQJ81382.1 hypothetical protein BTO16_01775 [Polaribacter glomeratus]TXD64819.1 hypothetical protein ESX12_13465 [Polaribacter glomeratus]